MASAWAPNRAPVRRAVAQPAHRTPQHCLGGALLPRASRTNTSVPFPWKRDALGLRMLNDEGPGILGIFIPGLNLLTNDVKCTCKTILYQLECCAPVADRVREP